MQRRPQSETTNRAHLLREGCRASRGHRRGFSLLELVVVISVTVVLAGLLMPALKGLRDHAERVLSASNMRQIGLGLTMYSTDNMNRLPPSAFLRHSDSSKMQEMMALRVGANAPKFGFDQSETKLAGIVLEANRGWEGVGLLFDTAYVDASQVFYSPSHRGDHPFERYDDHFTRRDDLIYSNFHYRGDLDWENNNRFVTLARDSHRVMLTDGMRTKRDFNHRIGYNSLKGDGSVFWRLDIGGRIYSLLPDNADAGGKHSGGSAGSGSGGATTGSVYEEVWKLVDAGE